MEEDVQQPPETVEVHTVEGLPVTVDPRKVLRALGWDGVLHLLAEEFPNIDVTVELKQGQQSRYDGPERGPICAVDPPQSRMPHLRRRK